jgi:hypothetical protein
VAAYRLLCLRNPVLAVAGIPVAAGVDIAAAVVFVIVAAAAVAGEAGEAVDIHREGL